MRQATEREETTMTQTTTWERTANGSRCRCRTESNGTTAYTYGCTERRDDGRWDASAAGLTTQWGSQRQAERWAEARALRWGRQG